MAGVESGHETKGNASAEIAQSLKALSGVNAKLERMMAKIGGKADNAEFREGMMRERANGKKLCATIMQLLHSAEKPVVERYNKEFSKELEKWKDISMQIEAKEKEVVVAIQSHGDPDQRDDGPATALLSGQRQGNMQAHDLFVPFTEQNAEEIRRREEGIRGIEQDVKEVSEMFQDLANLVHEQEEPLNLIENNLTAAKNKTAQAHEQIRQAEDLQKKSRKKNCCLLFLVLAVVGLVTLGIIVAR